MENSLPDTRSRRLAVPGSEEAKLGLAVAPITEAGRAGLDPGLDIVLLPAHQIPAELPPCWK